MRSKIVLKSGKAESVLRFHPWIFSGAIKKIYGPVEDGDMVDVFDNQDQYLSTGHYGTGSIAVRVLGYDQEKTGYEILESKIRSAWQYREALGYTERADCNAFRLVFAEGDGLPGLIIDWYNGVAVLQAHSMGMFQCRTDIVSILKDLLGDRLLAVYDKSAETMGKKPGSAVVNSFLSGNTGEVEIIEHGCRFQINFVEGQKTGFFIDQRENRLLLMRMAADKRVLNTFSYTGGFTVAALKGGAARADSVDSSAKAIDMLKRNMELNGFDPSLHAAFCEDTMHFLERTREQYDIIILDPPAYAKHLDARHHAVQGYKRLNAQALSKLAPGGWLFTFSCSQVVDRRLFNATVVSAAIVAGRRVRIVHQLSQPPDHPINAFHPEGEYLKGLVLYVE